MKPLHYVLAVLLMCCTAACSTPTSTPAATPAAASPTGAAPAATPSAPPAAPSAAPTAATVPAPADATAAPPTATSGPPTVVGTSTANPTVAGGLVGLWKGNNNSYYLLNVDGTWNWDESGQNVLTAPENQGRWWLEGDVFRIQDTAGKAPCPLAQIGSYQAQLSGDTLVLVAIADLCAPRIDQTAGQYARQPAGP
jgi:hypothetical protein